MMKPIGEDTLDFRTWDNEFFQVSIDSFHQQSCLLITSTLEDCAFLLRARLSIEKSREWAKSQSENKHEVKNSFSGYFTFGKKLLKQYDTLEKHMAEHGIYFSDETLEKCYKELCRRKKDERSTGT